MYTLTILLLLFPSVLWLAALLMLREVKYFWRICITHTLIFITYMAFVLCFSRQFIGTDEFGVGEICLVYLLITIHSIVGFVQGLYLSSKKRPTR